MIDIIKQSILYKTGAYLSKMWEQSRIKKYFASEGGKVAANSRTYHFFCFALNALHGFSMRFGDRVNSVVEESSLVSDSLALGRRAAAYFKASFLCRLIERISEVEFNFSDLRLYHITTFLLVAAAPMVPTMVCAGIAVITLLLYLLDMIRRKEALYSPGTVGFWVVLLIVIFGFFAFFSLTPKSSIRIWILYSAFMLFIFPLIKTALSADRLCKIASIMTFSGLLVSLLGIYQRFFGDNFGHAWLDKEMFESITVRVYSTLENPNVLGEYLLLAMPVCAALLCTRRTWLSRFYYSGILITMAVCMIFTQSRGCWLGLILSAAVFALFVDPRLVVLEILALFALPFVMPESIITRFTSIGNVNDSSTSYRLFIWLGTLNMLRDFGIYGIGLGSDAYNKIYPFYSYSAIKAPHAHNIYLQLLCETGITGLAAFLATIWAALKKTLIAVVESEKTFTGVFASAVFAGLLGFLLQGAFDYVWYNYRVFLIFWSVVALGVSAGSLIGKSKEDALCRQQ
ncbi:MAG: O-Antigen ligase [Firmicutes bacterium ADurb.Bin193]|nr:MAG: O-Antigen ligase [Firmicutes bacterium ADurb.Bin193]